MHMAFYMLNSKSSIPNLHLFIILLIMPFDKHSNTQFGKFDFMKQSY